MTANDYKNPGALSQREYGAILFGHFREHERRSSITRSDQLPGMGGKNIFTEM